MGVEKAPVSAVRTTLTGYRDGFWVGLETTATLLRVRRGCNLANGGGGSTKFACVLTEQHHKRFTASGADFGILSASPSMSASSGIYLL